MKTIEIHCAKSFTLINAELLYMTPHYVSGVEIVQHDRTIIFGV